MEDKGSKVPVGFPGEHKNISFIEGSASIAFLIYAEAVEVQ